MRDGEPFVYHVEDGVARLRAIEIVYEDGIRVGVKSGLAAGDRVVIYGIEKLSDGQSVSAVEES
jgi:hypothetical protein